MRATDAHLYLMASTFPSTTRAIPVRLPLVPTDWAVGIPAVPVPVAPKRSFY